MKAILVGTGGRAKRWFVRPRMAAFAGHWHAIKESPKAQCACVQENREAFCVTWHFGLLAVCLARATAGTGV